ncbi:MAG: hypothetical protein KC620_22765, partial [Myxococcales bacterium]|nr:hypothetical protein [Myxococcales bacterium]
MLKRARAVVPAALCALLLTAAPAAARTVLQHDSFQGGGQVAFYPSVGFEQVYGAIFIVPDDHPEYRICRVLAWFGPDDLGAFGLRFGEADENGGEVNNLPIWQTDEDVFQVAGSRAEMTAFDLREYDIITDVRRLRLLFRNESFAGGPGMATDTDGITPERNLISALLRDGRRFFDYTELLPMGGSTPQPPGDWIIRVDIARPNEECPRGDAPLPDAGPPVEDAGPEPDAAPEIDAAVDLDMGPPEDQGRRDAAPPQPDR